jgi:lipase maturation factor
VEEIDDLRPPPRPTYWLTRALFLRMLGLIYSVAYLALVRQVLPLIGSDGLLPARSFLARIREGQGSLRSAFTEMPNVFWLGVSDRALLLGAWTGLLLSLLVLCGFCNAIVMALLWFLYMSFVDVGQIWYGFGWEILLLETGFLAIFLCPPLRLHSLPERTPPPAVVVWLLRWVLFRVMFGAGLIKIRGDECWRDLTCLVYHYETQPLPNPLSWYLHHLPPWVHKTGVLWNHFVELCVPWFMFGPRRVRHAAGMLLAAFQVTLILSGNLSFLNWLTLTLCISCFDDGLLGRLVPRRLRERAEQLAATARMRRPRQAVVWALAAVVAILSVQPVGNMLSSGQIMNTSFDRLRLVNTYGAFGSVGRKRPEIVLQGTYDTEINDSTRWIDYEFKCKPGDVNRRPCIVAPYQLRVDWEIWFAAMSDYRHHPWLVHLVWKLLQGDRGALSLLGKNPFTRGPPVAIRAELYEYQFTRPGEHGWWKRRRIEGYLPPLTLSDSSLQQFLGRQGWLN